MGLSSQTYINQQNIKGPVAILWDIENCSVPGDVCPEDVAGNIRMTLRLHPIIQDVAITLFSAYGDFSAFLKRLREGCQRTGVKLVDVPNGRKDAADKAILVDMFLFALDNPPPSTILLISGDVDFSPALHILGQRGYTVILVIPAAVGVCWDWPSVARGDGFVPPKTLISRGSSQVAGYLRGCQINENPDTQNDEEAIVDRGITTHNEYAAQTNINQRNSHNHHSRSPPSGLNDVPAMPANEEDPIMLVHPGDINGLKGQLVKLLELSGGCLPLVRVPGDYNKVFGRPLCMAEYGVNKLGNLLKKMSDTMTVEGEGVKMYVYLRNANGINENVENSNQSAVFPEKHDRGKECEEETVDTNVCTTQNDDEANSYSGNSQPGLNDVPAMPAKEEEPTTRVQLQHGDIISLKGQLVKLLELSGGCLPLVRVPGDYNKIFGQQLCMAEYSVNKLVNLFKMSDTMTVEGEGEKRYVYLRNANDRHAKVEDINQSAVFPNKDGRGKGCEEETIGTNICPTQNDEEANSYSRNSQSGLSGGLAMPENKDKPPGDIISLKGQLVKLLELSGGCLTLFRFAGEYNKIFGRPLNMAEYGVNKLGNLLQKMLDTITVEGEGLKRYVYLRNANARHENVENSNQSAVYPKNDERGKGCQVETVDSTIPGCSSDEFSDDDKRVMVGPTSKSNDSLKQLKQEMQELLVSCSCKIHLDSFKEMYKQRYKKVLHHQSFGVNNLEELIDKQRDDVNLYEEQENKRKFLVPNFAKLRFQIF
ncbi:hypothetical protein MKX01_019015 [Papaver californicum]|nr:hypothetical protein MKX01_019015 [Papaver californicum]